MSLWFHVERVGGKIFIRLSPLINILVYGSIRVQKATISFMRFECKMHFNTCPHQVIEIFIRLHFFSYWHRTSNWNGCSDVWRGWTVLKWRHEFNLWCIWDTFVTLQFSIPSIPSLTVATHPEINLKTLLL